MRVLSRWVFALLFFALAGPATAQDGPPTAGAPDTTLAAFAGTWDLVLSDSLNGDIPGTLVVAEDGAAALTVAALGVDAAPVTGQPTADGGFAAEVIVPGADREVRSLFTLAPDERGDGLVGTLTTETGAQLGLTARRAAEAPVEP